MTPQGDDAPKKPTTETAVDRKIDAAVRDVLDKVKQVEDARDAATRKSIAAKVQRGGFGGVTDYMDRFPLAFSTLGVAFMAAGLMYLDGQKLYIAELIGVAFIPPLRSSIVSLVGGLAKAKKESQ
jgi:hypothetical protein